MTINTELWEWPQYTMISVYCLNFIAYGISHGTKKTGNWNIFTAIWSTVISIFVLYNGGFYK